jgi:hypothetical protein
VTFTDAINYVLDRITQADDDSLLTVTLTRFARHCANLPGALGWLDVFEREFRLERGRLNHIAASAKADDIRRIKDMIYP